MSDTESCPDPFLLSLASSAYKPKISLKSLIASRYCAPVSLGWIVSLSLDGSILGEMGSTSERAGIRRSARRRCCAGLDRRKSINNRAVFGWGGFGLKPAEFNVTTTGLAAWIRSRWPTCTKLTSLPSWPLRFACRDHLGSKLDRLDIRKM